MSESIFQEFEGSIRDPNKPLIETTDGRRLSYAEVVALAGRFANVLVANGVKPGDRVAVQVDKTPEALVLYLATVRAGAVYLPLNTAYTAAEIDYFIRDAEPRLLIADPARKSEFEPSVKAVGGSIETLDKTGAGSLADKAKAASPDFATVPRRGDDLAAILYTSGTTGRSKGAMLSNDNLLSNARALIDTWRFTSADVLLHALPIYHTHGLFVASNVVMFSGGTIILLPRFDPNEIMALLPRATTFMGVPTFYTRLLKHPGLTREATAHMRLFTSGSAPLLAETHDEWREKTGHAILERYGMTETNMNTSNPYDGDRIAGTVGMALPGVAVRITDPETGAGLKQGEIGMIEVKGGNVFSGYWRMPEKTREEFRSDGFFITGDLGQIDERGYVRIVGRSKDLVISGGFNVYPKEVEEEIDALPGVEESAVIGLPHPDFGEGVVACVVNRKDGPDEAAVLHALSGRLAKFKQPKRVLFVDELPRNTMGKVQKNLLRDRFTGLFKSEPR